MKKVISSFSIKSNPDGIIWTLSGVAAVVTFAAVQMCKSVAEALENSSWNIMKDLSELPEITSADIAINDPELLAALFDMNNEGGTPT